MGVSELQGSTPTHQSINHLLGQGETSQPTPHNRLERCVKNPCNM